MFLVGWKAGYERDHKIGFQVYLPLDISTADTNLDFKFGFLRMDTVRNPRRGLLAIDTSSCCRVGCRLSYATLYKPLQTLADHRG